MQIPTVVQKPLQCNEVARTLALLCDLNVTGNVSISSLPSILCLSSNLQVVLKTNLANYCFLSSPKRSAIYFLPQHASVYPKIFCARQGFTPYPHQHILLNLFAAVCFVHPAEGKILWYLETCILRTVFLSGRCVFSWNVLRKNLVCSSQIRMRQRASPGPQFCRILLSPPCKMQVW